MTRIPANLSLKLLLTETLINENKLDGEGNAILWIERLRRLGIDSGYIHFLEGRVSVANQHWDEAVKSLEKAQSMLVGNATITPRIQWMLAECYGQLGAEERRIDALRQLVENDRAPASAPSSLPGLWQGPPSLTRRSRCSYRTWSASPNCGSTCFVS